MSQKMLLFRPGTIPQAARPGAQIQVLRRFCLTVSFFAAWAMARPQPEPLLHFGGMVMVASVACVVLAVFGRARVADQRLNRGMRRSPILPSRCPSIWGRYRP
jgi:hypothetical protein